VKLTCVAPAGGIAVATGFAFAVPAATPTPSSVAVPIYRDDEAGLADSVKLVDTALVYNTDPGYAIPAGTPCRLERTNAGHYHVTEVPSSVAGTPKLGAVNYARVGLASSWNPDPNTWIGPNKF
jgi:hypothetical protein